MRTRLIMHFAVLGAIVPLAAQTQPALPQTARQAVIEMFLGDGTDAFAKHLPDSARKLLPQNGEAPYASPLYRISTLGRQMARGEHVETFDSGPTILISQQNQGQDKVEVAVEHDSLAGDTDEIELSVHVYHDGREQSLSVIPRLTFTLKQEKDIWRLIDFTAAARVPLTDPDYLRGLRQQLQEANESAAQMRVNSIASAESGYSEQHPDRGYTCSMPTLFAPRPVDTSSEDNPDPPQVFYDPGQGNSEWSGYRFAVTGCEGSPGSKYQITAVPVDSDAGTKTFCADESGTMKSVKGSRISACFSRGEVVSSANGPAMESDR
jgi:hypothetical protein